MPPNLDRFRPVFRKIHPQLDEFHKELTDIIKDLYSKIGSQPPQKVDTLTNVTAPKPPLCLFSVAAIGNVGFQITITNPQNVQPVTSALRTAQALRAPNASLTPILHNLQSATDTNFHSASNLKDYGVSTQTTFTVPGSGITLYWRLRSSFDGRHWNVYQIFSGPSGPIGVTA